MEDFRGSSDVNGKSVGHRGHWKPAEDEKLLRLIKQYGSKNWNFIAEHFPDRSGKSCRLRWYNQLHPNISRRPFTEEEEARLLHAQHLQGNKWASIASRFFPGRTDNAVKNHYHVIMARRKRGSILAPGNRRFRARLNMSRNLTRRCFGPNQSEYASKLFNLLHTGRQGSIPMSSSPSPPLSALSSAVTNDSSSLDVSDEETREGDHPDSGSSLAKVQSSHGRNDQSLNHYQPNSSVQSSGRSLLGPWISSPRVRFANPSSMSNGDLRGSKGKMVDGSMTSQSDGADGSDGASKRKDIPFIDFLGVGSS